MFLNKRKYVLELLENTGFLGTIPSYTPFGSNSSYLSDDPSSFRKLIGRLLCLTNTVPDISFSTQHLSQYIANSLLHIIKMLQGFYNI